MRCLLTLTVLTMLAMLTANNTRVVAKELGQNDIATILSHDSQARDRLLKDYRQRGPRGLDELVAAREALASQQSNQKTTPDQWLAFQADIAKLNAAIDEVGGAKYCSASSLYWYTDLAVAQAEATRTNKPILTLRMLGNLNEEFSCANSRFFRTTLYANKEISQILRDKFVLHWASVRPVPKVTIDFGDGRKIERTLTGNSAHYLLDCQGQPLDGLPGLYGPQAFQAWLTRAETLFAQYRTANANDRARLLRQFHQARLQSLAVAWAKDLKQIDAMAALPNGRYVPREAAQSASQAAFPSARTASRIAVPKYDVEARLINDLAFEGQLPPSMDSLTDAQWGRIAELHAAEAKIDNASLALMRTENPAGAAGRLSITKRAVEDPLVKLVRNLQSSIALDTVRNEYVLHGQLHQWFVDGSASTDINQLNEEVYAKLFLTPSSDPWLGLMQVDTYTGLRDAGVRVESTSHR